jgi:hypothetical protein
MGRSGTDGRPIVGLGLCCANTVWREGRRVRAVDQRVLRAAAAGYVAARDRYRDAKDAAAAAHDRLQASRDTLEYEIGWNLACKQEAHAAWRLKQAEAAYRAAGGYVDDSDE